MGLGALLLASGGGTTPVRALASDPVVAAAGDIACDPQSPSFNGGIGTTSNCRQKAVSDLMLDPAAFPGLAAVLPLGDNQ